MDNASTIKADDLGGRLQLLRPDELSDAQRSFYDQLRATKVESAKKSGFQTQLADGRLIGPFNFHLQSPAISRGFNAWLDAESEHSTLSAKVRQVVILTVGGDWHAAYEVYAHKALGREAGLSDATMQSLSAGYEPGGLDVSEQAAFRFAHALVRDRRVTDQLYAATLDALGVRGVIDMVHLIGLYLATSAILNAFNVPAPDDLSVA